MTPLGIKLSHNILHHKQTPNQLSYLLDGSIEEHLNELTILRRTLQLKKWNEYFYKDTYVISHVINTVVISFSQCVYSALEITTQLTRRNLETLPGSNKLIQLLVSVHLSYFCIQGRLSHFARLIELYPNLLDEHNLTKLTRQEGEMVSIHAKLIFFYFNFYFIFSLKIDIEVMITKQF